MCLFLRVLNFDDYSKRRSFARGPGAMSGITAGRWDKISGMLGDGNANLNPKRQESHFFFFSNFLMKS